MNYYKKISNYLIKNHLTLAIAESCTGGMIASKFVDISGVSRCFEYGFVTYSNEAKEKMIGVREGTIKKHGAVSKETAREMAKYVRNISGANIGIATTGIAGPDGGSPEKPVGLVYVSCAIGEVVCTRKYIFKGNRKKVRNQSATACVKLLYDMIAKYNL